MLKRHSGPAHRSPPTLLALGVGLLLAGQLPALAAGDCGSAYVDVPGTSALGSASMWANARSASDSLKVQSRTLLEQATANRKLVAPPESGCATGCKPAGPPLVVFRSVPNKFRVDYSDAGVCKKLEAQTRTAPFRYGGKTFASLDELNSWFSDFSQGDGPDGEDLYQRCSGNCSPQYTNVIDVTTNSKLNLFADVVCGPARDKSDNQYRLSIAYRFACRPKR
jgi:hypothetical protein